MDEFDLIDAYFKHLGKDLCGGPEVALGIGDDCALLRIPPDQHLAVSSDTLICGVHFPENTTPFDIGYKALAVNLSDLAAMGASPAWFSLCLTLPEVDSQWLSAFCDGMVASMAVTPMRLIGGDTTRGPLSISIQIMGLVASGKALCRHGASPGEDIYVSGCIGEAGVGLRSVLSDLPVGQNSFLEGNLQHCLNRLNCPSPRVALGMALRSIASACIDLSDGLLADLQHILKQSGAQSGTELGAELNTEAVPIAACLRDKQAVKALALDSLENARAFALNAGDDYELCFTAPASQREKIQALSNALSVPLTCIGQLEARPGMRDASGQRLKVQGYQHFRSGSVC